MVIQVVFGTGLDIAIGALLVTALLTYAGIRKLEKPLAWITAGALLFVAADVTAVGTGTNLGGYTLGIISFLSPLLAILGFIAILVGGVWAAYKLVKA
ncbi:MAG: hypothetical protein J4473_00925 [Candidatus Aenigmarchaeota archaeon]|nr:hypothetical protein [Candidatus Aenigmarchaeota archaeon]